MAKKIGIGIAIFIAVILGLLLIIPTFFKDDIRQAIDREVAKSITAKVYYDPDKFSLSLLSNFPHMTVKLGDFGIVGNAPFEGDTLVQVSEFNLVLNVWSLTGGSAIEINKVLLREPIIRAIRLPDGTANWNITKPDTTKPTEEPTKEPSKFALSVKGWAIEKGEIGYLDLQGGTLVNLHGLNHAGKGDFTNTVVDVTTKTVIDSMTVELDSVRYFNKTRFESTLAVKIDQEKQLYTLGDNLVKFNDFALAFSGTYQQLAAAQAFDMKFSSQDNTFKSLLSLVPAVYKKGYEDLKTEGVLSFDGFVKGQMQDSLLPALGLNLKVEKAMMQYPKLPSAVTNVNIDFGMQHPGGVKENMAIDLRQMHFEIGRNPFDARLKAKGLKRTELDGMVKTKLDLTEITQAFPVADMTLKGLFTLEATAKGVYEAATKTLPSVTAHVELMEGYVKSKAVPAPIEQLSMAADVSLDNGNPETGKFVLEKMRFVFEGEPVEATASVQNFSNYTYQATLKGKADVGKLTKIYPVQGMTVSGIVAADMRTAGNKTDVDAKRWDKLPTSGTMTFSNFSYSSASLAKPVTINRGAMTFDPQKVAITECVGKLGSSDYSLKGNITNYMAYALADGTLKGSMNLSSPKFQADEWTSSSEPKAGSSTKEPATAPAPEEAASGISVPKNLDIQMNTEIGTLLYQKYTLEQFVSNLIVKDGTVRMERLSFNTLDGGVKMKGSLDPTQAQPAFTYDMDIKSLSIPKTYQTVGSAQKLAPFMEKMSGLFSGTINLRGNMTPALSPDLKALTGTAVLQLNRAAIQNLDFPAKVNSLAKINLPTQFQMNDLRVTGDIKDGFVNFKPFELNAGTTKVGVSGRYGLDGALDYNLKIAVPAGAAGQMANQALSSFLGGRKVADLSTMVVDVKVAGTQTKPTYRIVGVSTGGASGGSGNAIKDIGTNALNQAKQEAEQRARQEADRLKQEAEQRARDEADRLKKEAERKAQEELQKLKNRFKF